MHMNRIHFTASAAARRNENRCLHAAYGLLGAWWQSGQLSERLLPLFEEADDYSAVALSPERNSLDRRFDSGFVTKAWAEAEAAGLTMVWQLLGEDPESRPICGCERSTAYVLFTTFICREPPVRCMDCFGPVPLYRFEVLESGDFYALICWQSDYQSCDSLWISSTVLERATLREMSSLDSSLTRAGRAHCESLAASSGRPFYYYLRRYHGRSLRSEVARSCPGCGGNWYLTSPLHGLFDFRCDQCRLLSNIADSVGV